jgi:hypothetical protein
VIAFKADGTTLWTQPDTRRCTAATSPAIGDVDQDGQPEVRSAGPLLDGKTGAIKKELDPMSGSHS